MRIRSAKTILLVSCIVAFGLQPSLVNAASVSFDFTSGGSAADLTGAGNSWRFSDNSGQGIAVEARGWSIDSSGAVTHTTVLQGAADYRAYGYTQNGTAQGLGVCGDSAGLAQCLSKADKFGLNSKSDAEWLLLTLDEFVSFESLEIAALTSRKGSLTIFSAVVDAETVGSASPTYSIDKQISFDYRRAAGKQVLDLQALGVGNAILIRADGSQTSIAVEGFQATVVPIPSAAWLMLSGLFVLVGSIQRRRKTV